MASVLKAKPSLGSLSKKLRVRLAIDQKNGWA